MLLNVVLGLVYTDNTKRIAGKQLNRYFSAVLFFCDFCFGVYFCKKGVTDTREYVTEKGMMDDVYELSMSGTGAMVGRMLTPGVSRVCRFGVLVSSAGAIGVDGLVIRYEIGGEAI